MSIAHTLPRFVQIRALEAFADAEDEGRVPTGAEIQAIVGSSYGAGAKVREALAAEGLLCVLSQPGPCAPAVCKLTERGWALLGRQPKASRARTRSCLKCGGEFLSRGPGHRVCDTCKRSDDWQTASLSDTHIRGASRTGVSA